MFGGELAARRFVVAFKKPFTHSSPL